VILEQSLAFRAIECMASTLARAAASSRVQAAATDAGRALRNLPRTQLVRCALVLLASATATYVSIEWALPAGARAAVGFSAVVLVLSAATAFAPAFRE
jgi:hypothetical protein